MDHRRLLLQEIFERIIGNKNVYFENPTFMDYPCIVYSRDSLDSVYADNRLYKWMQEYTVTVIEEDPESMLAHKIAMSLPYCRYSRNYVADNLHHTVLNLYF